MLLVKMRSQVKQKHTTRRKEPLSLIQATLRHIDTTRVGIANTLEVVTTSVIAYFWLGQHLTIWQIMGCTLVPISVIILQYEQQSSTGDQALICPQPTGLL